MFPESSCIYCIRLVDSLKIGDLKIDVRALMIYGVGGGGMMSTDQLDAGTLNSSAAGIDVQLLPSIDYFK